MSLEKNYTSGQMFSQNGSSQSPLFGTLQRGFSVSQRVTCPATSHHQLNGTNSSFKQLKQKPNFKMEDASNNLLFLWWGFNSWIFHELLLSQKVSLSSHLQSQISWKWKWKKSPFNPSVTGHWGWGRRGALDLLSGVLTSHATLPLVLLRQHSRAGDNKWWPGPAFL